MALAILFVTVLILLTCYRYYITRRVAQTVEPQWSRSTPARRKMDGIRFFPSPPGVLAGFQLKSISLDVVIGPVIAIQFGWLPALLWLLFGAIFFGWVLDYFSVMIPIRDNGNSLGDLFGEIFSPKSRKLILLFIYFYLLVLLSQLGLLLSTLIGRENVTSGILILVFAGFVAGLMIYRWRINYILASFVSVLIAIFGIWTTTSISFQNFIIAFNQYINEIGSDPYQTLLNSNAITWGSFFWLLIILSVSFFIAVFPMWRIAVPLNYVSSWLVILTLGIAAAGLLYGILNGSIDSKFEIPLLVTYFHPNLGPIWPILFVTLSSGAVSGWHSLVSSYSTSHQVEKEPFAMPVATGSMFTETVMVVIVIIFAATFGVSSGLFNSGQSYSLNAGPASILAVGLAKSWSSIGFPESLGGSISAMFLAMLGFTILHLALRFSGIVSSELFGSHHRHLANPKINQLFVILLTLIIIAFGFWQSLWILFAGANQLLAALILLLISAWLVKSEKSYLWTLIPSLALFVTALGALIYSVFYQELYQRFFLDQLNAPELTAGIFITIIFGLFFMIFGTYLYFAGLKKLNSSWTIRF